MRVTLTIEDERLAIKVAYAVLLTWPIFLTSIIALIGRKPLHRRLAFFLPGVSNLRRNRLLSGTSRRIFRFHSHCRHHFDGQAAEFRSYSYRREYLDLLTPCRPTGHMALPAVDFSSNGAPMTLTSQSAMAASRIASAALLKTSPQSEVGEAPHPRHR